VTTPPSCGDVWRLFSAQSVNSPSCLRLPRLTKTGSLYTKIAIPSAYWLRSTIRHRPTTPSSQQRYDTTHNPCSLAGDRDSVLCWRNLGAWIARHTMQRLTARFLLLFALVGTFVPLALAATAAPPHSCCLRKSAHQCHQPANAAADESDQRDQRSIHGAGCCNHDCCRAVTTSQSADPQPSSAPVYAPNVEGCIAAFHSNAPAAELLASQSTRAPPQVSIA
jgi:hypothetical protein